MASPPSSSPSRAWTWLLARWLRLVAVATLGALLVLRAAAPSLLEAWLEGEAARRLGRVVDVANVDLGVFAGKVSLETIRVASLSNEGPPGGSLSSDDVVLDARRVVLNVAMLALLAGDLRLEELRIEGPRVLRVRDANGALRPILRQEPPDEAGPAGGSLPPPIAFERITVGDAEFTYVDLSRPDRRPLKLGLEKLGLRNVSVRDGEVSIAGMTLHAPSVRMLSDFQVAALTEAGPQPEAAAEAPAETGAPLALRLKEIVLSDARVSLLGEDEGANFEGTVSLHAQDVSLFPDSSFPVVLSLQVDDGRATLAGEAMLVPPGFDGTLAWEGLALAKLAQAAGPALSGSVSAGTSSGTLGVRWVSEAGGGAGLSLAGEARVQGLAASDGAGLEVGWSDLAVAIDAISLDPGGERAPRVKLGSLRLRDPSLRVARSSAPAEESAGEAEAPEPAPSAESAHVAVAKLEIAGGALDFTDATVKPKHRTRVTELSVTGTDLRWPERRAGSLQISGQSDAGRISVDGNDSDLALKLSGIGLPPFSPYIAELGGYWVDEGSADLDARVRLNGDATSIDSKLVLHRLALTNVSPGTFEKRFGVPLDVGLALLRDPSGDIVVPIALTLGAKESRVATGSILLASFRQALLGALTSPLKGVGLLIGGRKKGEGFGLAPLVFAPGATQPLSDDGEQLAGMAGLLAARPGLGLRLRGRIGEEDAAGIAEHVLIEQVLADADLPPVDAGLLQRRRVTGALEERSRGEPGTLEGEDAAVFAQWVASVEVNDAQREAFAEARAAAVRDLLVRVHGVEEERLAVGEPLEGEPAVVLQLAPAGR